MIQTSEKQRTESFRAEKWVSTKLPFANCLPGPQPQLPMAIRDDMAMGQSRVPPVNIPIPSKIGSKTGGAPTPKWDPIGFDNHSQIKSPRLSEPRQALDSKRNIHLVLVVSKGIRGVRSIFPSLHISRQPEMGLPIENPCGSWRSQGTASHQKRLGHKNGSHCRGCRGPEWPARCSKKLPEAKVLAWLTLEEEQNIT